MFVRVRYLLVLYLLTLLQANVSLIRIRIFKGCKVCKSEKLGFNESVTKAFLFSSPMLIKNTSTWTKQGHKDSSLVCNIPLCSMKSTVLYLRTFPSCRKGKAYTCTAHCTLYSRWESFPILYGLQQKPLSGQHAVFVFNGIHSPTTEINHTGACSYHGTSMDKKHPVT